MAFSFDWECSYVFVHATTAHAGLLKEGRDVCWLRTFAEEIDQVTTRIDIKYYKKKKITSIIKVVGSSAFH